MADYRSPSVEPIQVNDHMELTLYSPQDFEAIMSDPTDIQPLPGAIHDPAPWIVELHRRMSETYEGVRQLAQQQHKDRIDGQELARLKQQYEHIRVQYTICANMVKLGVQVSDQQIQHFRQQVENASATFADEIWGAIAVITQDERQRQQAIEQLRESAKRHQAALLTLEKEITYQKKFNKQVEIWALQRDQHIDGLLAKKFVDPSTLDEHGRTVIEQVKKLTEEALEEFRTQLKQNPDADIDSVWRSLSQRASTRPSQPSVAVPSKVSSSTRRVRDRLTTQALQDAQARRTARQANIQFESSRAGPMYMTPTPNGGGGGSLPPRRFVATNGEPPSDPDDSDSDDSHEDHQERRPPADGAGGGPPRGPPASRNRPRSPSPSGRDDLTRLIRQFSQAPVQVNPVHMAKPPAYDGRDLSKFRSWWLKVEAYMDSYPTGFPTDQVRINWVGSLLTDKAQVWHQQRVSQVRRLGLVDVWSNYTTAIKERFRDTAERYRNARKMQELRYQGDISQYLTELMDLNEVVQWSGTTFQSHISKALPDEITKLIYSRQGGVPETDEDFLHAIQEAGHIYENMLTNPGISVGHRAGKDTPTSISERSKSGPPHQSRSQQTSNPSLRSSKAPSKAPSGRPDPKDIKWATVKEALAGISQDNVDRHKKDGSTCWRCGRNNHHTLACFARKDVSGNDLPAAPPKVAGVKRKAEEKEKENELAPPKKVRIDAIGVHIDEDEPPVFEVLDDDMSGTETGFH